MAWGNEAAEQHEKDQPTELIREDGSIRGSLLPKGTVRQQAERFQAAMDDVRRASSALGEELRQLEIYARERAGDVRGQYLSTEASRAYVDMADRIKALRGES
jgi:hypothetical protein